MASAQTITLPPQTDTANDFWCRKITGAVDQCNQNPKAVINVDLKREGDVYTIKTCSEAKTQFASCANATKSTCSTTYDSYLENIKSQSSAAAVGGCENKTFLTCQSYLEGQELDDFDSLEDKNGGSIEELFAACPYFAAEDAKKKKEEEKELEEKVVDGEKKLKDLLDKIKEDQDTTTTTQSDMQKEIAELESKAQEALTSLQTELTKIQSDGQAMTGKIRDTITSLTYGLEQKKITDMGNATISYQKIITEVQQQCYQVGLRAAAAESARLKSGSSSSYSMSVAQKGIIQHLREKANEAYRQCQEMRTFKGPLESALQVYTSQQKSLDLEIKQTNERIAALKSEFQKLPQNIQQDSQSVTTQKYQESQGYTSQVQVKKQAMQQLMQISQKNQMLKQQELYAAQTEQANNEKALRALRSKIRIAKAHEKPGAATYEKFAEALSACKSFKLVKLEVHHACCPDGKNPINGQRSACLTDTEKGNWNYKEVPSATKSEGH